MPASIGRLVLVPRIGEFRELFPDVDLMIELGDQSYDSIHEGMDRAIRIGEREESSLIQRRLGDLLILTAASPDHIFRYGEPKRVEEIKQHLAVQYFSNHTEKISNFRFDVDGVSVEVKMRTKLSVSDADAYVTCGASGFGMIQAPRFILAPYLKSGALLEVLSQWRPRPMPIAAGDIGEPPDGRSRPGNRQQGLWLIRFERSRCTRVPPVSPLYESRVAATCLKRAAVQRPPMAVGAGRLTCSG